MEYNKQELILSDDSMNIFDLISIMLRRWLLIFFVTIVSMVVSLFIAFNLDAEFEEKFNIKKISTFDELNYEIINQNYDNPFMADKVNEANKEDKFLSITSESLMFDIFSILNERTFLIEEIQKTDLVDKQNPDIENYNYDSALKIFANTNFLFQLPDPNEINSKFLIITKGKFDDQLTMKNIVYKIWTKSEAELRKRFAYFLEKKLEAYKYKLEHEKKSIENQKNATIYRKSLRIDRHLNYLKEQSLIAKGLGIKDNITLGNNNNIVNIDSVSNSISTNASYYLKGYVAIDKEIEILNASKQNIYNDAALIDLEYQLRTLENDTYIDTISNAFEATPILDQKYVFSAGYLGEVTDLKIMSDKKLFAIVGTLFGLVSSVIFVVFREYYSKYKLNS